MEMNNQIQMIDIELLEEHPDNPRKEVGDVAELSESIKRSGVMQNLTVVEHEGKYRVVIGHRRLAASKKAGLTKLPCCVTEMSYKDQIATMLSENMQRIDLKLSEQVFSVQQLLNLGENVSQISERTGLSKTAIGKRAKIASIPQSDFAKAEERGATLEEYLKAVSITDEEDRQGVIEKLGTRDFEWTFEKASSKQKDKKMLPLFEKEAKWLNLQEIDSNERWNSKYEEVMHFLLRDFKEVQEDLLKIVSKRQHYFCRSGSYVYILKKATAQKKVVERRSEKEIEANRRFNELSELSKETYALRRKFMLNFKTTKETEEIANKYLRLIAAKRFAKYQSDNTSFIKEAINDKSDSYYADEEKLFKWAENPNSAAHLAYALAGDSYCQRYFNTQLKKEAFPTHFENKNLNEIYDFLKPLGYQMSTVEEELTNGTHELFKEWEE